MKLKEDFITHEIDGVHFLIAVDNEAFNGIVRNNETAAFIVEQLKEETTTDKIIDAVCDKYDASRETVAADVEEVLNTLRGIHALVET